jgi:BMFP domain-containing protein YqiC
VIVVAIAASFVRTRERITRVETKVEHLEKQVTPIPGMSRAIARLEGINNQ